MKKLIFTTLLFLGITTQAQTCLNFNTKAIEEEITTEDTKICVLPKTREIQINNDFYSIVNAKTTDEFNYFEATNDNITYSIMFLKSEPFVALINTKTNEKQAFIIK